MPDWAGWVFSGLLLLFGSSVLITGYNCRVYSMLDIRNCFLSFFDGPMLITVALGVPVIIAT